MRSLRDFVFFVASFAGSSFLLSLFLLSKEVTAFPLTKTATTPPTHSYGLTFRYYRNNGGGGTLVSKTCLASSSSYGGGGGQVDSKSPGFVGFSNVDFAQRAGTGSSGDYVAPMQGPGAETTTTTRNSVSNSRRRSSNSDQGYQNRPPPRGDPSSYDDYQQQQQSQRVGGGGGGESYRRDNINPGYRETYNTRREYEEPRQERNNQEFRDQIRGGGDEYLDTKRGNNNDPYYDSNSRNDQRGRYYNERDEYQPEDRRRRGGSIMDGRVEFDLGENYPGRDIGNRASDPYVSYNGRGGYDENDERRRGRRFNPNNDGYPNDDRYSNSPYEQRERRMGGPPIMGPLENEYFGSARPVQPPPPPPPQQLGYNPNDSLNVRGNENFDRAAYDPLMNQQPSAASRGGDFGVDYNNGERQVVMRNDRDPYDDGLFNAVNPPEDYYNIDRMMNEDPRLGVVDPTGFHEERRIPQSRDDIMNPADNFRQAPPPPPMEEDRGGPPPPPPASPAARVALGRKERYVRLTPDEMKQPRYSQRYASYDDDENHPLGRRRRRGEEERPMMTQPQQLGYPPRYGRGRRRGRRNVNESVYDGLSPKERSKQQRQDDFNHGTRPTYFTPGQYGGI